MRVLLASIDGEGEEHVAGCFAEGVVAGEDIDCRPATTGPAYRRIHHALRPALAGH